MSRHILRENNLPAVLVVSVKKANNGRNEHCISKGPNMTCVHLKQLYDLCIKEDLKIGGTDLIRIVCKQCGEQDVCPSMLMDEYEAQHPEDRFDGDEGCTHSPGSTADAS